MKLRKGDSDVRVFRQIFERDVYHFLPQHLKVNTIIDAWANVGYSSLWFNEMFPKAKIIAAEPQKKKFKFLTINAKTVPGIVLLEKGLWPRKSLLKIDNPHKGSWSFVKTEVSVNDKYDIETVILDDIIADQHLETIDILKIDIERAEKEFFSENIDH